MTDLKLTLADNEWMKIVSNNNKSKLLPAMRNCATNALRGNLRTRSMLFRMKLVDSPNCILCPDGVRDTPFHRLYQCPNSKALWNMVNEYLMEFRDWMSSNRDAQYYIDHSLYIAEKEVLVNFYEEHPNSVICLVVLIVKFYLLS